MRTHEQIAAGRQALEEGRWAEARVSFEAAVAASEDAGALEDAEALDGLGEALWWLCEARESVRYRERAFVGFRAAGQPISACRVAIHLCISYLVNLDNEAAARGWLARAERVVSDVDGDPMAGWLTLMRGFFEPDPEGARTAFADALAFARRSGDADLELVALADLGLALVTAGRIPEGFLLLDEAMAGTLGGEYRRRDTVVFASCDMLSACRLAGDLDRATKWCDVADAFVRQYGSPFLFARCRVHYGGVLLAKGRWSQAETELQAALRMAEDAGREPRIEALVQLAGLRLRQGRHEEAATFLAAVEVEPAAATMAAEINLAQGQPRAAIEILERRIRQLGNEHIDLAPTLELLVRSWIEAGEPRRAVSALDRLLDVARDSSFARDGALAERASAQLTIAIGRPDDASRHLERAIALFTALDLPLETARARLELARLLREANPDLAIAETRAALASFERLGARPDADAGDAFLRTFGRRGRSGPKDIGTLTRREQEVLELIGIGLSNPEIAKRLFISRKTAAHHVSSLLSKLGLRNRAELVAIAIRPELSVSREPRSLPNGPRRSS